MIERFRLFIGQGVTHEDYGYGVIRKVGERTSKSVEVKFADSDQRVEIGSLRTSFSSRERLSVLRYRYSVHRSCHVRVDCWRRHLDSGLTGRAWSNSQEDREATTRGGRISPSRRV